MLEKSIDFLDVTVYKCPRFQTDEQKLDTKVYFKPTDTYESLYCSLYHPKYTYRGIMKSQIERFYRICLNKQDFDEASTILSGALKHKDYAPR